MKGFLKKFLTHSGTKRRTFPNGKRSRDKSSICFGCSQFTIKKVDHGVMLSSPFYQTSFKSRNFPSTPGIVLLLGGGTDGPTIQHTVEEVFLCPAQAGDQNEPSHHHRSEERGDTRSEDAANPGHKTMLTCYGGHKPRHKALSTRGREGGSHITEP